MENTLSLGPLQYCNLDDANYMLSRGRASKEHAQAYVDMWNRPGMRFTKASLGERVVNLHGVEMLAPWIEISE
jgi:hypothetical protein